MTASTKPCIECGKECEILPVQLGDSFTSKQLADSASNSEKREADEVYQQLYDVLIDVASNRDGGICSTKLGNRMKDYKDRICNGMRLKEAGKDRTNKTLWKLVSA